MDIKAEINWIHQEIDKVKDPSFIEKLKHLLQSINNPTIDTDSAYNIDIDNALDDISKGNVYDEDEARAITKKY
ncbi:hypothetical protein ACWA1F_23390 [Flavobacterium sp. 3-218]